MSLEPSSYEERLKRARKNDQWRRESARRYEDSKREEGKKFSDMERTGGPKRRGVMEAHKDDPDKYGELFEAVREMGCMGREWLVGHECGIGVAPPSAHHLEDKDSEGMVPACGKLHDRLEERWWEVEDELDEAGSPPLEELGRMYVERAREDG